MVTVDWLLLAEYAQVKSNVATIVGAGIDSVYATALPDAGFAVEVVIVTRWSMEKREHGRVIRFSVTARDPDARVLGVFNDTMGVSPGADLTRFSRVMLVHTIPLQFTTFSEGEHIIELALEDVVVSRTPITVYHSR